MTLVTGCGKNVLEPAELSGQGRIDRAAVEQVEAGTPAGRAGGCCAAMLTARHDHHRQRGLVVLADDQDVAAALRPEDDAGRILDRDCVAQPGRIGLGGLGPFGRFAAAR